jgi:hypothetical protein
MNNHTIQIWDPVYERAATPKFCKSGSDARLQGQSYSTDDRNSILKPEKKKKKKKKGKIFMENGP